MGKSPAKGAKGGQWVIKRRLEHNLKLSVGQVADHKKKKSSALFGFYKEAFLISSMVYYKKKFGNFELNHLSCLCVNNLLVCCICELKIHLIFFSLEKI